MAPLFSVLSFRESCGTGHGEKMKVHAAVVTVEISHEKGEGVTHEPAAFIELAEICEKAAGIILRHARKGFLCGNEDGVAQKAEQQRVHAVLNDASAAVEDLAAGRENAYSDIGQSPEGMAVIRGRKSAGRWKTEGFISLQPDGTPFLQMAEKGDILCKIFCFRAVKFYTHLRHETDRVVFQHFPGDAALFGLVGNGRQKFLYFG